MNEERRKELIMEILDDVYVNLHSYHHFVLQCVKNEVERWNDEDLLRWVEGETINE